MADSFTSLTLSKLLEQPPLSGTRLEKEAHNRIGQFICNFALVELMVHKLFRRVSGMKENNARALVAGMDLAKVIVKTKLLAELLPSKKLSALNKKEIDDLCHQIGEISPLRNSIIHGGIDVEGTTLRTVNYNKAKTKESVQEITLKLNDIDNATLDLARISFRIHYLVSPKPDMRKHVLRYRRMPWLYKRLPIGSWWARLLGDALKHLPQSQSSQAKP